jgi:hypothetical protein
MLLGDWPARSKIGFIVQDPQFCSGDCKEGTETGNDVAQEPFVTYWNPDDYRPVRLRPSGASNPNAADEADQHPVSSVTTSTPW